MLAPITAASKDKEGKDKIDNNSQSQECHRELLNSCVPKDAPKKKEMNQDPMVFQPTQPT